MIRTISSEFNRPQKELIILIVLFWSFLKTIREAGPMEKNSYKYLVLPSFHSIFIEARSGVRNFLEKDYSMLFIVNLEEREGQTKKVGGETSDLSRQ